MLSTEEKSQLTKQADELQNSIRTLRKHLTELNEQKEKLFDQRNTIGKQISELIKNVKGIRSERDTFTAEVKLSKEEREKLNNDIKTRTTEVATLTAARDLIIKKTGMTEDPRMLRRELERLNYKMETDAMSFEKETKLMKVINQYRKKLLAAKDITIANDKLWAASKDLDRMRAIANQAHNKVTHAAKESQEKHQGMVSVSHQIDDLKAKEEAFNSQIVTKKAEMQPIMAELDVKNAQLTELNQKLGIAREEQHSQKAAEQNKKITDKAGEVKQKFLRGEKLTTEEFLLLQSVEK